VRPAIPSSLPPSQGSVGFTAIPTTRSSNIELNVLPLGRDASNGGKKYPKK
jgi:hypothetical protein